jgi:outer membrane lipoprotein SlyB
MGNLIERQGMTVIRQTSVLLTTILVFLALTSCTNKSAVESSEKRHATVLMQDGTKVTGTVEASSPSEITLVGDDNITRTIPMNQVKSIAYSGEASGQPKASARRGTVRDQLEQSTPQTKTYELPAGTEISVRSDETIDSSKAAEGQSFAAEISKDVLDSSGAVAIPRGSNAQLVIVSASKGGRIRGASDLTLALGSVTVGGQRYEVDAGNLQQRGKSGLGANKRTAEFTGGGTGLGAIIGAIAGGGKGAAIGAGAGAGAGALTQILTKGKAIRVPAESVLTFKLDKPLRIVAVD